MSDEEEIYNVLKNSLREDIDGNHGSNAVEFAETAFAMVLDDAIRNGKTRDGEPEALAASVVIGALMAELIRHEPILNGLGVSAQNEITAQIVADIKEDGIDDRGTVQVNLESPIRTVTISTVMVVNRQLGRFTPDSKTLRAPLLDMANRVVSTILMRAIRRTGAMNPNVIRELKERHSHKWKPTGPGVPSQQASIANRQKTSTPKKEPKNKKRPVPTPPWIEQPNEH